MAQYQVRELNLTEIPVRRGQSIGSEFAASGAIPEGTVTTVSVVPANGFSGSVATADSTPAITLTTTITGLLKGNGTAISAAGAGTDYLTPTGSAAGLTSFPTLNQNTTGSAATLTTGRTIGMTGDVTWTSASFNGSSDVSGTSTISNDAVTNTKLANVPTSTFKGRVTASTGDPEDLTGTQATTLLDAATTSLKGLMSAGDKAKLDVITSGTYTPTLTNVTNLDASTAYSCQYLRVGDVVTVTGRVDIDPTTTALSTRLNISLPIASDFTALNECAGAASAFTVAGQCAAIIADATNNEATMRWKASDTSNVAMMFSFSYRIL